MGVEPIYMSVPSVGGRGGRHADVLGDRRYMAGTLASVGLGWLSGPIIGSTLWKLAHGKVLTVMEVKDRGKATHSWPSGPGNERDRLEQSEPLEGIRWNLEEMALMFLILQSSTSILSATAPTRLATRPQIRRLTFTERRYLSGPLTTDLG